MTVLRTIVGWLSWMLIACALSGACLSYFGGYDYLFLPALFYQWLDDVVAPTNCESSADLEGWSTAVVLAVGAHAGVAALCLLVARLCGLGTQLSRLVRRVFPVVGWLSWSLVSVFAVVCLGEAWYLASGGKLSNDTGIVVLEFVCSCLFVGALHLAIRRVASR